LLHDTRGKHMPCMDRKQHSHLATATEQPGFEGSKVRCENTSCASSEEEEYKKQKS
jgi:hypothetical protein